MPKKKKQKKPPQAPPPAEENPAVPRRGKGLYVAINLALLGFLYYCIAFRRVVSVWTAFAAAAFFLFNGAWSANRSLYSWLHRDDTTGAGFLHGAWVFFLAVGGVLLAAGIAGLVFGGRT